jgi:serine/threonine protein phosphatase PrpC
VSAAARFASAAVSHAGARRRLNEDAFLDRPDLGLWAVADGMGGHQAGDYASRRVVEALDVDGPADDPQALLARVEAAVDRVNDELYRGAGALGDDVVFGTTLVGLVLAERRFAVFWAGDSRVYLLRGPEARRLTRDDSEVQRLVDMGALAPEAARGHPLGHLVTAAVGVDATVELHVRHGRFAAADRFLLCSDGLTEALTDGEIAAAAADRPPADAVQALLDAALAHGAADNVTAVVVDPAGAHGDGR